MVTEIVFHAEYLKLLLLFKYFLIFLSVSQAKREKTYLVSTSVIWIAVVFKVTRPSFYRGYHPTLKLSSIPTFTFIVSITHRMDNI